MYKQAQVTQDMHICMLMHYTSFGKP